MTIRLLLADDHPLVRQGLLAVLASAPDINVVGEAVDGAEAVRLAAALLPDVVLMDLQMPELPGIEAIRAIVAARPETGVLALTMFDDDATVFTALAAGAVGYLVKGADGAEIISAVRSAASGQAIFDQSLTARLRTWLAPRPASSGAAFPELTPRELEILDELAAGRTNAEIGSALHLSAKTIANNVSTILTKLQVTQRSQAIVLARDAGLGRRDDGSRPQSS